MGSALEGESMQSWTRCVAMAAVAIASGFSLACNQVAGEPEGEAAASASVSQAGPPAGSDLTQVTGNTRIYYQFIDAKGGVRFVERLTDVPELWRAQAGFVEMSSPPPLSPADARRTREMHAGPSRRVITSSQPDVLLYYADWCGYCRKAKSHLNSRGVPYELRDVDTPAAKSELLAKTGSKGIPVMDIGGRIAKGYSKRTYDEMLAAAGY